MHDFGFHHPFKMVEIVTIILKRSNFTCWPDSGGLLDQEMNWIEDVLTYLAVERYFDHDYEQVDEEQSALTLDDLG